MLEGSMIHDIAGELSSNWHAAILTRHSLQLDIIYVSERVIEGHPSSLNKPSIDEFHPSGRNL